jgi:hypothetical protein
VPEMRPEQDQGGWERKIPPAVAALLGLPVAGKVSGTMFVGR